MASKIQRTNGKPALEIIEEAIHLLRLARASTFVFYLLGTLPFLLGFLYFWADMSRSAYAELRSASGALGIALLFLWMRTWQTVFMSRLREQMAGASPLRWTFRRWVKAFVQQSAIQPAALFILPIAFVITLPFGWAYAFFHNYAAFGDGQSLAVKPSLRRAAIQAKLWPGQNHLILLALFPFGFFIFLNVITAIVVVPSFIKMFLGIETVFSQAGGAAIFNSTLLLSALALVYLCVDPLLRAVYVMRCFYGESLVTGEDLCVELDASRNRLKSGVAIALLTLACSLNGFAAEKTVVEPAPRIAAPELNEAIERTMSKREYSWRLPREKLPEEVKQAGWIENVFRSFQKTMTEWARSIRDTIRSIYEWFEKVFKKKERAKQSSSSGSGTGWMTSLQWLLFILIAVLASVIAILCYRMWKQRRMQPDVVVAQAVPVVPNLESDDVTASQLPEDGWMKLARELMERGELRLALRALYLASLAHLAHREFVSIAKFKSNRDYEIELRRRARSIPELQAAFSANVGVFDRVWYGMHEVTGEALQQFQANLERIRAC